MPERAREGEAEGPDLARGRARGGRGRDRAAHAARARAARARVRRRPGTRAWSSRRRAGTSRIMEVAEQMVRARRRAERVTLVDPELAGARARARAGARRRLRRALRRGAPAASRISLDDGRVERPQGGRERGACVRVVQGDSTYYGHVDGLAEEDLLRVADSVSAGGARRGDAPRGAERGREPGAATPIGRRPEDVEAAPQGGAAARVRRARPRRGRRGRAGAHRLRRERAGRSRCSARTGAPRPTTARASGSSAQVVARRDGRVETGTRHARRPRRLGAARGPSPSEVAEKAARRALTLLDAVDAPTGRLPVVVGQRLRRRAAPRGGRPRPRGRRRPEARQRLRRPARRAAGAEPFVTAYDDGSRAERVGQRRRSTTRARPRSRTTVIEDGPAHLLPLRPAARAQGRRGVDRQRPPRVVPPPADPAHDEHLLRARRRHAGGADRRASSAGLYAVSFGGGQVEPATGDFVFGVSEGYLIENGKVTAPVRGATLIGNGLEALRAIDGIAGDLDDRHRLLRQGRPAGAGRRRASRTCASAS